MTKQRDSAAVDSQKGYNNERREERYKVPEDCQRYIQLWVKSVDKFVPAVLGNFSRSGILFECPVPFSKGDRTECVIAISLLVSRELSFGIEVRYCYSDNGIHIIGASIDTISDEAWFDVFVDVHDFVIVRKGSR
ncbi:MAG TPA: PilZ domain-containing protein [Nitrospirota bacterium]|nr:PilZ domain-containing protein [Nitrospirota bacterium]